jgi:outer membrane protein OmpA-like peptidoglycan-associated protein
MKKMSLPSRLISLLVIPGTALAQSVPPPPPPAAPAHSEWTSTTAAPDASSAGASAPANGNESNGILPRPEGPPARPASANETIEEPPRAWNAARALALGMGNTLLGPSGLLHVISADSGDAGTVRISLMGSYFSGKGFLCPNCETANGNLFTRPDTVRVSTQRLQLSVTPLDFLETQAAVRFRQAYNNRGTPQVTQISNDVWLGAKAFTPRGDGRRLSAGGGINIGLLSEAGGIGVGTANVLLHGEATLDLTQNAEAQKAIPLRVHLNAGYLFDNSGALAETIEKKRSATLGSAQRVTRIERFGFDISRMDSVRFGLGVEGVFPYLRPFAEWTLDLPANRQSYTCRRSSLSAGDQCLTRDKGFDSTPSRLTLGARGYPWLTPWARGLGVLVAVDIGTGATSSFVEEVTPELPWALHFGLAYAVDTRPLVEKVTKRETVRVLIPPPPAQYIEGTVVDTSGQPIAQAAVLFKDSDRPGILSDSGGHFRTVDLTEGPYTFRVRKDGFADSECSGTVIKTEPAPTLGPTPPLRAARTPAAHVTEVKCELRPLPSGARVDGIVRDAESTEYVPSAAVRASDARNRALSLQTDGSGAFRFENVPPGKLRVQVEAEGYLPSAVELELKPRDTVTVQVSIHKRPKLSNVVVTKKELKLRKQVHFLHDSSEILPDSQELVEEIAEALRTRPEIAAVEIQGHTDNSGTPEHNQALSERRAEAVRGALILLGIEANRLVARGYGQQQPLAPNTSPANKARNRRVQLMIQGP